MLDARAFALYHPKHSPASMQNQFPLSQNSIHSPLELIFIFYLKNSPHKICFGTSRVEFAFLPSVQGFFISSTLISFFLTLRVEFTSLCNLLNFTDSSVSSSDCSLDWQRNKNAVNYTNAPGLCSCSRVQPSLTAVLQLNLGHQQICPTGSQSSTYHLQV